MLSTGHVVGDENRTVADPPSGLNQMLINCGHQRGTGGCVSKRVASLKSQSQHDVEDSKKGGHRLWRGEASFDAREQGLARIVGLELQHL